MHDFGLNLFVQVRKTIKGIAEDNWANWNVEKLLEDFIELCNNYGIIVNFHRWGNDIVAM